MTSLITIDIYCIFLYLYNRCTVLITSRIIIKSINLQIVLKNTLQLFRTLLLFRILYFAYYFQEKFLLADRSWTPHRWSAVSAPNRLRRTKTCWPASASSPSRHRRTSTARTRSTDSCLTLPALDWWMTQHFFSRATENWLFVRTFQIRSGRRSKKWRAVS